MTTTNANVNRQSPPGPISLAIIASLNALASLKLTVTLFALSIFLIYAGTTAQVESGIWTVMGNYFRTMIAWVEVRPLSFGLIKGDVVFPFPGGWIIGGLLLVNLLAAHLMRFRVTWKRCGIIMIHTGLIVLVLSEFVTGLAAEEGQMTIWEGGASNFVEDIREVELAIVDKTEPRFDEVDAIPQSRIEKAAKEPITVDDPAVPFVVRIEKFMPNAQLLGARGLGRMLANPADAGVGLEVVAQELPAVSGTDPNQSANFAAAYVTLLDRPSGQSVGTYLTAVQLATQQVPQVIQHDGRAYYLFLRFKRTYKPYAIRLDDFKHERYPGTNKPKTFESHIRIVDPARGENRTAIIRMNHPLRYGGETFFQAAFTEGDTGTVLQVVNNPGWLMPYASCTLITLGLVVQFLISLTRFMGRRPA